MLALRHIAESVNDPLMVMKFWLIVSGIYLWEFVTTFDFEWRVMRGHQRYRWSIWIYSFTRLSCLTVVILALINFSITSEINCQAWVTIGWAVSALGGYGLSSILIMLRIYAIWDRSKVVLAISATIWVINLGFQLAGIIKIRAVWVPAANACSISNVETCRGFYITLLATDVILLLIMLTGLLRLRLHARPFLDLVCVLWKQGVIWLFIATAAELPQVLLLFLNLNDSFNFLFLLPSMITIVIAATRMYRALTYYVSTPGNTGNTTGADSSGVPKNNRMVSGTKNSSIVVPPNRLEVKVHRAYEEYPMSQMSRCESYPSSTSRPADNKALRELGLDDNSNVEGRDEKI